MSVQTESKFVGFEHSVHGPALYFQDYSIPLIGMFEKIEEQVMHIQGGSTDTFAKVKARLLLHDYIRPTLTSLRSIKP